MPASEYYSNHSQVKTVGRINRCLLSKCSNTLGMIQNGHEAPGKLSIMTPPFTSMTIRPWLCIFLRIGLLRRRRRRSLNNAWGSLENCCCNKLAGKSILEQDLHVYNV